MSPPAEQSWHVVVRVTLMNKHAAEGTGTGVQVLRPNNTSQSNRYHLHDIVTHPEDWTPWAVK